MLLNNKGKAFELNHAGRVHLIPEGEFHCNKTLGVFIKGKNKQWEDTDVEILDDSQELIDLQGIVPVEKKEEPKEELKNQGGEKVEGNEEVPLKEEVKKEKGKINKTK